MNQVEFTKAETALTAEIIERYGLHCDCAQDGDEKGAQAHKRVMELAKQTLGYLYDKNPKLARAEWKGY